MIRPLVSFLVLAGLLGLVSACASTREEFSAADEQAIRDSSARYAKLESSKDAEAWAAISTADAVMMPAGEQPVQGRDALIAWARKIPPGGTLEATSEEIRGRGDLAVERGTFKATMPAAAGSAAQSVSGSYLVVWERQQDGSWQISRNIWNTNTP